MSSHVNVTNINNHEDEDEEDLGVITHPALYKLSDDDILKLLMLVEDELGKDNVTEELLDLVEPLCREQDLRVRNAKRHENK